MEAARDAGGGVVWRRTIQLSGERKIFHHALVVCSADNGGFAQSTLALAILALEQVASTLFAAEDLPCTRDLESLGDGLASLCFT